jgi:hypothetical protein
LPRFSVAKSDTNAYISVHHNFRATHPEKQPHPEKIDGWWLAPEKEKGP